MKVTLALATFCLVAACADAQKGRTTTTTATKPGRFLSLPVPAKCASRKYSKKKTLSPPAVDNFVYKYFNLNGPQWQWVFAVTKSKSVKR